VGAAVGCRPSAAGPVFDVWLGAVAGRPLRLDAVERALAGAPRGEAAAIARRAAEEVAGTIDAYDDIHGSADYKRHLAAVLVGRMAGEAAQRFQGASA
jgi:carbon-monoxide dehydrogenase medium subunit